MISPVLLELFLPFFFKIFDCGDMADRDQASRCDWLMLSTIPIPNERISPIWFLNRQDLYT